MFIPINLSLLFFSIFLLLSLIPIKGFLGTIVFAVCCYSLGRWPINCFIKSSHGDGAFSSSGPITRIGIFTTCGMTILAFLLFLIRFIGISELPALTVIIAPILFLNFYKFRISYETLIRCLFPYLRSFDTFLIMSMFTVYIIVISMFMVFDGTTYYFKDLLSPMIDLQIARATDINIPMQNISYFGVKQGYYFFPHLLIAIFYKYFSLSPLAVVYRVFPLFCFGLNTILIYGLLRLLNVSKRIAVIGIICIVFASSGIYRWCEFDWFGTIAATSTFYMGFMVFLASIYAIIEAEKNNKYYILATFLVSSLLLVKSSMFIVLISGMTLTGLIVLIKQHKWHFLIFTAISICIAATYFPLMSSSFNSQDQWAFVPSFFVTYPLSEAARSSYFLSGIFLLLSPFYTYGILGIIFFLGFYVLGYTLIKRDSGKGNFKEIFLFSLVLPGCVAPMVVYELTANNATVFAVPSQLIMWILLIYYIGKIKFKKLVAVFILPIVVLAVYTRVANDEYSWMVPMSFSRQPVISRMGNMLAIGRSKIIQTVEHTKEFFGDEKGAKRKIIAYRSFSNDFKQALYYIHNNSRKDEVFLLGKHSEDRNWYRYKYREDYDPWNIKFYYVYFPQMFVTRSAIAGRQTVIEAYKTFGNCVQEDYNMRSLENYRFFYHAIAHDTVSNKLWNSPPPYSPVKPLKKELDPFIRKKWFNPHYNYLDARVQYPRFIRGNWDMVICDGWNEKQVQNWMLEYILHFNIKFILFESGEEPKSEIIKALGLSKAFKRGDYSVYQTSYMHRYGYNVIDIPGSPKAKRIRTD